MHGGEPNADCAPVEVLLGCTGRMDALTKARELGIQAPQISLFTEVTAEDVDLASDGQIRWRYWLDGLFVETHE
ncbi:MAG: hypothetical protein JWP32_1767 [Schumannella sp.]|nr:hypothetical protein [Schumannella sp.]